MRYTVPRSSSEMMSKYGLIMAAIGLAIINVVIGIVHNLADVLLIGHAGH